MARMEQSPPTQALAAGAPERVLLPDLARACALFGIAVVNVGLFAYPGAVGYGLGALASPLDRAAFFLVLALFALKSYSLFSMMFGAGFGQQLEAAQRQGRQPGPRYLRRLLGLALLGVFNVLAFFHGDILLIYAGLGLLLLMFRHRTPRSLMRWAAGLYALQLGLLAVLAALLSAMNHFAPDEKARMLAELPAELAKAKAGFSQGGLLAVSLHRASTWAQDIGAALILQGPGALAFMLFGLAMLRQGWLAEPAHPVWRRCLRLWLPLGLLLSAAGATLVLAGGKFFSPSAMWGLVLLTLGSPAASAGYLGLLAWWVQRPPSRLRSALARTGSTSLSAYLLQGLLLSLVFSGYGLGLYGQLGAAACIGIAALAGASSMALMAAWRLRFARGPFEWLLRGITAGSMHRRH